MSFPELVKIQMLAPGRNPFICDVPAHLRNNLVFYPLSMGIEPDSVISVFSRPAPAPAAGINFEINNGSQATIVVVFAMMGHRVQK